MQTSRNRKAYIAIFAILAMLPFIAATAVSAHDRNTTQNNEQRAIITGHTIPAIVGKTAQGLIAPDRVLHLSISLTPRNAQGLDALITAQKDHTSPLYQHFLTSAQFIAEFSPTPTTVNAVVGYLQSQGLTVQGVTTNQLIINASGTAANIEHAFNIQIAQFTLGDRLVYAPINDPSVPLAFGAMIQAINGLDDVTLPHNLGRSTLTAATPNVGSGPTGGYAPGDLRTAYDANPLINWGFNGTGQTIGIFEESNYDGNDLNNYRQHYGLGTASVNNIFVNVTPPYESGSGAQENDLDLDVISAMAPGATLDVYMGPGDQSGMQNFIALWQKMITDNIAKVLSTSWGDCEAHFSAADISTLDTLFKQAAAQGQTIFAASGDEGPYDCMFGDTSISVDYPASDPNVVGVGGTTLTTNRDYTYRTESAWSCATCYHKPDRPDGLATGGGYSGIFSRPSYQTGTGVNLGGSRQVPDVAANADPATGYSIYCTTVSAGCGPSGWYYTGGTSGSAPLWAAIAADVDQYMSSIGNTSVLLNNTLLYTLFNAPQDGPPFHDITTGNNLYYNAVTGYDLATGLGSPDVWYLAQDAARQTYPKFVSSQTSSNSVSMAVLNGTLYVAWTGTGNHQICLMHSTDGGRSFDNSTEYTSQETSPVPVSLVAYNNTLYVAWSGTGNKTLNVMHSTDGGNSFDSRTKFTSTETSGNGPAMTVFNNALYITWAGTGNHQICLMHSTDGGNTFDNSHKYVSSETTPNTPALAATSANIYIAWTGTGNNLISLMHSSDGGNSFDSNTKYITPDTSAVGVSLANYNGALYLAWTGSGNGYLSYMHSTNGNITFDESTKILLLSEVSPVAYLTAINSNTLYISWVGSGNGYLCLLSQTLKP